MQNIITYADKVALNSNSSIPDINKVNDTDMNEIKSIVNGTLQGTNAMGSIVVEDVNCKNLFELGDIVTPGYLDASGNVVTTDNTLSYQNRFIEVKPNTQYTISSNTSTIYRIAEYNQSCTFITRQYNTASTSYTFTTGANTSYIKMGGTLTTVLGSLQIEEGDTATSYVEGKRIIKEQNGYVKENTTFYANDFKCKNLFNKGAVPSSNFGYRLDSTGGKYADTDYFVSNYIEVNSNTTYTINYTPVARTRICYYNSSKTFISKNDDSATFTTPSNCSYIRFCNLQTEMSGIQLEIGSTSTNYTPYKTFENNEVYSIGEIKIGTWIDGKPLYRIVKQLTTPSTAMTETTIAENVLSNCDTFVNITGIINSGTNQWKINQQYDPTGATTNYYACIYYNKSTNKVNGRVGSSLISKTVNIILEYTKTTD